MCLANKLSYGGTEMEGVTSMSPFNHTKSLVSCRLVRTFLIMHLMLCILLYNFINQSLTPQAGVQFLSAGA